MSDSVVVLERFDIFPKVQTSDQQGCPLILLPPEIRMMILRLLLVHDGPLRARKQQMQVGWSRTNPNTPEWYVQQALDRSDAQYDIHPALLASCQILSAEGLPVLYDLNTIGLQFNAHGVMLYADLEKSAQANTQIEFLEKLIAKFKRVHIDVRFVAAEDTDFRDLILGLSDVLRGKAVQIQFTRPDDQIYDTVALYNTPEGMIEDQLRDFQLLRCEEFRVLNPTFDQSYLLGITDIVTSDEPVVNLYPSVSDFEEYYLEVNLYLHPEWSHWQRHSFIETTRWYDMRQAALDFDVEDFRERRAAWMKELDEEHEKHIQKVYRNDMLHRLPPVV